MGSLLLSPLAKDRSEVADVECDHDASFLGGQCQHIDIGEPVQLSMLIKRKHIVIPSSQPLGDHPAGDMGVKQQTRGSTPRELALR